MGSQRPPSRHKEPTLNQGLDLPPEDHVFIDEDSDSDQDFEIGIDKASSSKKKKFLDEDSFEPNNDSIDGFEMAEDFNMDSFLNNNNKRVISTAIPAQKTIE